MEAMQIINKIAALPDMLRAKSKVSRAQHSVLEMYKNGQITQEQAGVIMDGFASMTVNIQSLSVDARINHTDNTIHNENGSISSGAMVGTNSRREEGITGSRISDLCIGAR